MNNQPNPLPTVRLYANGEGKHWWAVLPHQSRGELEAIVDDFITRAGDQGAPTRDYLREALIVVNRSSDRNRVMRYIATIRKLAEPDTRAPTSASCYYMYLALSRREPEPNDFDWPQILTEWLSAAARAGHPDALVMLARAHLRGEAPAWYPDLNHAFGYLKQAAEKGSEVAHQVLTNLAS